MANLTKVTGPMKIFLKIENHLAFSVLTIYEFAQIF